MNEEMKSEFNDMRVSFLILMALQAVDHPHSTWFRILLVGMLLALTAARLAPLIWRFLKFVWSLRLVIRSC